MERRNNDSEPRPAATNRELSVALSDDIITPEFKELPYEQQIETVLRELTHLKGFVLPGEDNPENLPVAIEAKYDKPWGGYVTLRKTEKAEGDEVEKILVVRPTPNPIPDEWNTQDAFAQHLMANLGKLGTSLSTQRHHKRQREEWETLYGEGYHITSDSEAELPELDSLKFSRITKGSSVQHSNSTWHTVCNTGPEFLVISEMIYCKPGEPHSEEDIDRAYDLYSRVGTNKNI